MPQTESQTTVVEDNKEVKKRGPMKKVLTPPEKKEAKEGQHITPRGNDLIVEFDGTYGMYIVKAARGPLPKSLKGKFTEAERAHKAIMSYLAHEYR